MGHDLSRRHVIKVGAAAGALAAAGIRIPRVLGAQPPPLEVKDNYVVGFPQVEENNPWRIAQSDSMRAEAEARGDELIYSNANGSAQQQIQDVAALIARGVDMIFLPPREETPLAQAVLLAYAAGIPVICLDRDVDQDIVQAGNQYICFIGSDFYQEGARAAEWLVNETGGTAQIIELEGTTGSTPALDRQRGFRDYLAGTYDPSEHGDIPEAPPAEGFPEMEIVASQTGDFARDLGREVFETLFAAHPGTTAVYAHNDEMVLGAIAALEAQGGVAGEDITFVSIDGSRDALQSIVDGKLGATVECNPRFGPVAFATLDDYAAGEDIPAFIINEDRFFDASNAEEFLDEAY